jgi:hypothetical protein
VDVRPATAGVLALVESSVGGLNDQRLPHRRRLHEAHRPVSHITSTCVRPEGTKRNPARGETASGEARDSGFGVRAALCP